MFEWIKVLSRISREENYMEKSAERLSKLRSEIEILEERHKKCTALVKETNAALERGKENMDRLISDLKKLSSDADTKLADIKTEADNASASLREALVDCSKLAEDKLLEIRQQAEQYTASVNGQITKYEQNFAQFNKKLDELKQAVTDFQR